MWFDIKFRKKNFFEILREIAQNVINSNFKKGKFLQYFFSFLADCAKAANASNEQQEDSERSQNLQDEVLNFPTNCPECGAPADTKMKLTSEFICIFL